MAQISRRSYHELTQATSWEEIWEAGPYFDRVSDLLEEVETSAILVGWQLDSRLPMGRRIGCDLTRTRETLREKILRLCDEKPSLQVYFLIWDHAYIYVLERETWQGRKWDEIHPRVHFVFDNHHPLGGSHHEKICIFDGKTALCGGIDLCDERWDSPDHLYSDPRRSLSWKRENHGPYHDVAVQVGGPICRTLHFHVARRWESLCSVPFPEPPRLRTAEPIRGHRIYLSRTIAEVGFGNEHPLVREVEFLFRDLVRAAKKRIILEGQYFWSRDFNDLLITKIEEMHGTSFELILIFTELENIKSLTRTMSRHQLELFDALQKAADFNKVHLTLGSASVRPPESAETLPFKPVYIHSKVLVVDDRYLSIGSANFAARALRLDTEVQLTLEAKGPADRAHIRRVGEKILDHWNTRGETERDIWLRPFHANLRLNEIRPRIENDVPWDYLFDPTLPWLYSRKRILEEHVFSHRRTTEAMMVCLVGLSGLLVWILALGTGIRGAEAAFFAFLLGSVWLLPVPYVPLILLAGFQLGPETAASLLLFSLWIAGLFGYFIYRTTPTAARTLVRLRSGTLAKRVGRRTFAAVLELVLDPRIPVRDKIAHTGLFSLPFPWVALAVGIILPAVLNGLIVLASSLPQSFQEFFRNSEPVWVTLILLGCLKNLCEPKR